MGMANPLISQISQSLHYTPFLSAPGYQVSQGVSLSTRRNGGRLIGYALAIFLHFGNALSVVRRQSDGLASKFAEGRRRHWGRWFCGDCRPWRDTTVPGMRLRPMRAHRRKIS